MTRRLRIAWCLVALLGCYAVPHRIAELIAAHHTQDSPAMSNDVTVHQRVQAVRDGYAYAYRHVTRATTSRNQVEAAFWRSICLACLAELDDCAAALFAGVDNTHPAARFIDPRADIHQEA